MREWFENLGTRERMILAIGIVLAIPLLVWALIWAPLANGVRTLEREVEAQRDTVVWMQQAAAELRTLRGSGVRAAGGLGGRSLLAVVDQSARSAGLGAGLKRIEPDSGDAVRVRFEGVAFDTVVRWLDQLTKQFGVTATLVSVEREASPGQVNMRLTLNALSP